MRLFKTHFVEYTDQITMKTALVTEDEVWREAAELKEVEVRVTGKSADVADNLKVKVGRLSYVARPEKGRFFQRDLLDELHRASVAAQVVSVDELPEDHDVFVTMERDGRRKKFQLGSEGTPAIREVLNDSNEEVLDVDELVERCTQRVRGLLSRTGGEWHPAWSRPQQGT